MNSLPINDNGSSCREKDLEVKPNISIALDFLTRFSEGNLTVLTSMLPDGKTSTKTFSSSETEEMSNFIEARSQTENIYFSVNPVKNRMSKKASKLTLRNLLGSMLTLIQTKARGLRQQGKKSKTYLTFPR